MSPYLHCQSSLNCSSGSNPAAFNGSCIYWTESGSNLFLPKWPRMIRSTCNPQIKNELKTNLRRQEILPKVFGFVSVGFWQIPSTWSHFGATRSLTRLLNTHGPSNKLKTLKCLNDMMRRNRTTDLISPVCRARTSIPCTRSHMVSLRFFIMSVGALSFNKPPYNMFKQKPLNRFIKSLIIKCPFNNLKGDDQLKLDNFHGQWSHQTSVVVNCPFARSLYRSVCRDL